MSGDTGEKGTRHRGAGVTGRAKNLKDFTNGIPDVRSTRETDPVEVRKSYDQEGER